MGYSTEFEGGFSIEPALTPEDREFLVKFNETRRMARNVGPEYGIEGEWYVDGKGDFGQNRDETIIDYNKPPETQPELWCQWRPTEDGKTLEWDGGEKAYSMEDWIVYLIECFFIPKGYTLNGHVSAQGEEYDDQWEIRVSNNEISLKGIVGSYLKVLPQIRKVKAAAREDLPKFLGLRAEILESPKLRANGGALLLKEIDRRLQELEG